ncbi:hypothetical protein Drose_09700 [Dactylosporangium roseum]|uniref:Uncharacterized protein n=1 Tax=Dactylosporangium roseum TaxID=47989 RepID=A0ABY5Z9Z0_9ACTN|nr:hypothetical protein [Dactylosporangium roseum]UWZ38479.1 hypothetical protein Drose_09700 [Dactylosporangium roseum]
MLSDELLLADLRRVAALLDPVPPAASAPPCLAPPADPSTPLHRPSTGDNLDGSP